MAMSDAKLAAFTALGNEWRKGDAHRIYFNDLPAFYGLDVTRYGTGNISSARLDGAAISNSAAAAICRRLLNGRIWIDVPTRQWWHQGLAVEDFERIRAGIRARAAAPAVA